jgi:hypothetical protein
LQRLLADKEVAMHPVRLAVFAFASSALLACSSTDPPPRGLVIDSGSYAGHVAGAYHLENGTTLDFVFHLNADELDTWRQGGTIDIGVNGAAIYRQQSEPNGSLQELVVGGADVLRLRDDDAQKAKLRTFFDPSPDGASYGDILDLGRMLADQPRMSPGHLAYLALLPGVAHVDEVFPPSVHHTGGGGRDPRYCCQAECNADENDCHAFCGEETGNCFTQCATNYPEPGHDRNVCNQGCLLFSLTCHELCETQGRLCRERCPI